MTGPLKILAALRMARTLLSRRPAGFHLVLVLAEADDDRVADPRGDRQRRVWLVGLEARERDAALAERLGEAQHGQRVMLHSAQRRGHDAVLDIDLERRQLRHSRNRPR